MTNQRFKQPKANDYDVEPLTLGARKLWDNLRMPNCDSCELHSWAKTVCMFGNGPVPSNGMIVGEGPGTTEDERSRPFQGRSGKYLEDMLMDLDMYREQLYITNATKCKPPVENKDKLLKIAVKECAPYLDQEIRAVKPKVILAIGQYAYFYFVHRLGIVKNRGREFFDEKHNCIVVPTVHPSFIFRNPDYHELFAADLTKFRNILYDIKPPEVDVVEIHSMEDWAEAKKALWENPSHILTFDVETRGLLDYQPWSRMWCVSFTRDGKKVYMVPLEHPDSPFIEDPDPDWASKWPDVHTRIDSKYKQLIEDVCDLAMMNDTNNHNIKFDIRHILGLAKRYGIYNKYYELGLVGGGTNERSTD